MLGSKPKTPNSRAFCNTTENGFIVHHVSKLDTLAGVAIKYGVEVADVKRLNGLVTDSQMFAHKVLKIPLGGRHPPSTTLTAGSPGHFPPLDSREKRFSSTAMDLLRGYYGLSPQSPESSSSKARFPDEDEHSDNEPFSPIMRSPMSDIQNEEPKERTKAASPLGNGFMSDSEHFLKADSPPVPSSADGSNERLVRRRVKADGSSSEVESKQDTNLIDKLQPTSGVSVAPEASGVLPVSIFKALDGALMGGKTKESPISRVRKSSSTSCLQENTSFPVNLSKLEVKISNALTLTQGGSRISSDMPPKPVAYRFKAALD